MSWTNWGFDGTINEAQWAQMAGLLGNGYVAAGNGDCLVTAVGGARSVSVAAGTLYGDGVVSVNSGAETVAMTTPVNGQWYVIALRRTWATNTAALVAIASATTSTTTPTTPPTSFPTLNTNTGVLTDQPIAWAWCNSANTTVVVYDIRLKAVKSLPPVVANQGERDAKFMSPTQGLQVWRDDLGTGQTYFGLYNASGNPGGRDSAGWYTNSITDGMIPVTATSVSVPGGSVTVGPMNRITYSSTSSSNGITVNGCFTSAYKNYKIVLTVPSANANAQFLFQLTQSGTPSSVNYMTSGSGGSSTTGNPYIEIMYGNYTTGTGAVSFDVYQPNETINTTVTHDWLYDDGGTFLYTRKGTRHRVATAYDGFKLYGPTSITATIQIFGYNW